MGRERRFGERGRKEEDYEEGMRWCTLKKSAREAEREREIILRGMEWRRKERRKGGDERRFCERGRKEEEMKKGKRGNGSRETKENEKNKGKTSIERETF